MAQQENRRRYERYTSNIEIAFRYIFDFTTKIRYQIMEGGRERVASKKYSGLSRDISVEGLRFSSAEKLIRGDILRIEVYLPQRPEPVCLDAEVKWSRENPFSYSYETRYETGVQILSVNGKAVGPTVHFDSNKKVYWSDVLDAILRHLLEGDQKQ